MYRRWKFAKGTQPQRGFNVAGLTRSSPPRTYSLLINRKSVPKVWRRSLPIIVGLVPGVVVGSVLLALVNSGLIKARGEVGPGAIAAVH